MTSGGVHVIFWRAADGLVMASPNGPGTGTVPLFVGSRGAAEEALKRETPGSYCFALECSRDKVGVVRRDGVGVQTLH